MTWVKLGSEWADEARSLSDSAYRLHIDALCYSNRRALDLLVPKRDVRRFAEADDPDTLIVELVRDQWWEDRGDDWWIGCQFPEWQQTHAQVEATRKKNNRAQKRKRLHEAGDHSTCLPRNCPLAPSSDDRADESSAMSSRFPERNGTEAVTGAVPKTDGYGLGFCAVCGHREKIGPEGLCSGCFVASAVGAAS